MKFAISAGHDDKAPGNTWQGVREADLMLELRHIVAMKLRAAGHEVVEDGPKGVNQPLTAAMKLVGQVDVAVELHTNASTDTRAEGVEVLAGFKDRELAQKIAHAIGSVLAIPTRRTAGWYDHVTYAKEKGTTAGFVRSGGLIVEVFFQSNAEEYRKYTERFWLVGSAIARTLHEHSLK